MAEQLGFDFGSGDQSVKFIQPSGAWLDPELTSSQFAVMFSRAEVLLSAVTAPAALLFARGITRALAENHRVSAHHDDGEPYCLPRIRCQATDQEFEDFVSHCRSMRAVTRPGTEFKVRDRFANLTTAMYVDGLGTLVARRWTPDHQGIDFRPWRGSIFYDSYLDDMLLMMAPHSLWGKTYCADKLAESGEGVPSVPSFTLNGREYVNTGESGDGVYWECYAWSLRALADWGGPLFDYHSQCSAWDDGTLERGDRRGLVVRARGRKYVLDGAVTIRDKQGGKRIFWSAAESHPEIPNVRENMIGQRDG